jgi:hypothetical protein
VHQHGHPVDEPPKVVVELLDLVRLQAERRIAVLADLRKRKATPSLDLGLLTSVLVRLVIVLVVMLVIVIVVVMVVFVCHSASQSRESS